jgi:hypothetical protein
MRPTLVSHPQAAGYVVSRSARAEVDHVWTATDQRIGIATAFTLFATALVYVGIMTLGFVAAGGLDAPLVDPVFAIMGLLILVQAPLIVVLFATLCRYAAPAHRSFSLAAFGLALVTAVITLSVHFVLLTVGRQVPPSLLPGFDRYFSFQWPSVAYALYILSWNYCFGLALLVAAAIFTGGRLERAVRPGMIIAGVLCLAGLLGVVTANMQIRNVGIVGYGGDRGRHPPARSRVRPRAGRQRDGGPR